MKIWDFIQNELLGMSYLNRMIGFLLEKIGIETSGKWGGTLQFFLYDTIKITILLCILIFVISYIQSFFPPEKSKRILGKYRGLFDLSQCGEQHCRQNRDDGHTSTLKKLIFLLFSAI